MAGDTAYVILLCVAKYRILIIIIICLSTQNGCTVRARRTTVTVRCCDGHSCKKKKTFRASGFEGRGKKKEDFYS